MSKGLWGKKVGMTQIFSDDNKVVPATVIDVSNWYVLQIKTKDKDGYDALKLGLLKVKFHGQTFSNDWLKDLNNFFSDVKEAGLNAAAENITVGQLFIYDQLEKGSCVDVFGLSKGAGFQGVVKRHGFAGGRASHGATFGRFPGSLSFMRSRGRVIKGKRMPGRMGMERNVMKNLEVLSMEPNSNIVLVKGSVPGKSGSLVFVRKCGN